MLRLFNIEYYKLRHTRYFWVLLSCFLLFLIAVPIGSKVFIDYLTRISEGQNVIGELDLSELPLFDFVDIWQNLTWIYKNFSILLGFILVISICNEYAYGTIKQNVIDGLSRLEFLWTKISLILSASLASMALVFGIGLIMGLLWSPVKQLDFIFLNVEFVLAYGLHLIGFLLFCLVIGVYLRKSGLALAMLIFYIYIIENIAYAFLRFKLELPWLADLLPVKALGNIIRMPFGKYALQETQTSVSWSDTLTVCIYIGLFLLLLHRRFRKKDLM